MLRSGRDSKVISELTLIQLILWGKMWLLWQFRDLNSIPGVRGPVSRGVQHHPALLRRQVIIRVLKTLGWRHHNRDRVVKPLRDAVNLQDGAGAVHGNHPIFNKITQDPWDWSKSYLQYIFICHASVSPHKKGFPLCRRRPITVACLDPDIIFASLFFWAEIEIETQKFTIRNTRWWSLPIFLRIRMKLWKILGLTTS